MGYSIIYSVDSTTRLIIEAQTGTTTRTTGASGDGDFGISMTMTMTTTSATVLGGGIGFEAIGGGGIPRDATEILMVSELNIAENVPEKCLSKRG